MTNTSFENTLAQTYRTVWTNTASRMLLIPNGMAECKALQNDYEHLCGPIKENLWSRVFGTGPFGKMVTPNGKGAVHYVPQTHGQTRFLSHLQYEGVGWFKHVLGTQGIPGHLFRVTIVNLDKMTPETFMAGITGMSEEFCRENRAGAMRLTAEMLSTAVRTKLHHALFLYPSEDTSFLIEFKAVMDTVYREFSISVPAESK